MIELSGVSLRFTTYHDKYYSLKRACIDLFLRRETSNHSAFWALRDVSLGIARGERVGILGPNGAGKSTLLRVMAGIYPPTSGRLRVEGRVAPLIELGAGFNYELSGEDNVYLNGALLGFDRREMRARIDRIWEFSGLRQFAGLPLKYYSSGMLSRLSFAVATEVAPDILLLDETLSVGDASFKAKAHERIMSVIERSSVVILVSHDMTSLSKICTRGVWIDHGTIRRDGPIDEVIQAYTEEVGHSSPAAGSNHEIPTADAA
ncbi:ABC transporter ATP-binding protein [Tautonia sociabilis]|uniref:ABC transporter ATP-binding protein n=1 Tax=Tautonia sociabilis TaxID=2080755 RepID=UPI001F361844|nr:ABC transporter ATP-binding protein [Tautonia sociabilis]